MIIAVLIKRIPDLSELKFDVKTGRLIREGVRSIINPLDKNALEEAIRIKETVGCSVTAVSMGPPSASESLNFTLKMGVDQAILISDRDFAGSDTLVTARILSEALKKIKPDLVLAGDFSLDASTSQVPPEVAERLHFNFVSSASRIEISEDLLTATVEQQDPESVVSMSVPLPAVISVGEKINKPRYVRASTPDMSDRITVWDSSVVASGISGTKDSATFVDGTTVLDRGRKTRLLVSADEAVNVIMDIVGKQPTTGKERTISPAQRRGKGYVMGLALQDPETSVEIASKLYELTDGSDLSVEMVGTIDPEKLKGMPCHRYTYLGDSDIIAVTDYLQKRIFEQKPKFVIFPSNIPGREIAARIAARMDLGLTADCVGLEFTGDELVQLKPAFGDGLISRIRSRTAPQLTTVRPGIFEAVKVNVNMEVKILKLKQRSPIKILSKKFLPSQFRPLRGSRIILSIGRGATDATTIEMVKDAAGKLGAGIGGSRPVIDTGLLPPQQQVGITGLSVSPDLYVALGISGDANHVAGIRYANKVLAVNSDRNAPIFKYADYGLVGDAGEFMRTLLDTIKNRS